MRCIYLCILSASCEKDATLCPHTSMYTTGFLQVVPHTPCVWWASTNPSCVASKYSVLRTTSIDLRSHCVWRLTRTVPLSPSHRVVYLAHTVLLTSVLLLPSLAQCLLHCCNCVTRTVAYQSLPCTMSCSSITLYCNPPQRVSAVLSIPTLQ